MTLGFADTVDQAVEGYWVSAAAFVFGTIEEAGRRLIARSPIGMPSAWKKKPPPGYVPGKFISNWNLGVGRADPTVTEARNIRTVNGLDRIPAYPFGQRFVISNSSPQALRLELDNWSRQAPDGMVRLTGLEHDQIFRIARERAVAVSGPREMHRGGYGR
jgi:hypothetical protein